MLIISNHLRGKIDFPKETIVRVNMAWFKNRVELGKVLSEAMHPILLDLPSGRSKPPKPILTLDDAIWAIREFPYILYFAISNAENAREVKSICGMVGNVGIILKIETLLGIENLKDILSVCRARAIMLDKEDLYLAVERNNIKFEALVKKLREDCYAMNIPLLELQGVIFG